MAKKPTIKFDFSIHAFNVDGVAISSCSLFASGIKSGETLPNGCFTVASYASLNPVPGDRRISATQQAVMMDRLAADIRDAIAIGGKLVADYDLSDLHSRIIEALLEAQTNIDAGMSASVWK